MECTFVRRFVGVPMAVLACGIMVGMAVSVANAEVVFQAGFNGTDPSGANGVVQIGGTGNTFGYTEFNSTIELGAPMAPGTGGKMQIDITPTTAAPYMGFAGAQFQPTSEASWFNSWYTNDGANDTMTGAFDYFYRTSVDHADVSQSLRLDTGVTSNGFRMFISNNASGDVFFELGRVVGGAYSSIFIETGSLDFPADTIMHFAVTAQEVGVGQTEFKLFVDTEGNEIDPLTDTPLLESGAVHLDPLDEVSASFPLSGGNSFLGIRPSVNGWNNTTATLEYDNFTIYNDVPVTFAPIPEPGSMALLNVGALVALLRRRLR